MQISPNLIGFFWSAVVAAGIATIALLIGLTLLLGTVPHRKVALPIVWISASILIASAVAVILIWVHH